MKELIKTPLLYPYYFGPGVRRATSALLWSGELAVAMPGILAEDPFSIFFATLDLAKKTNHPLLPLFGACQHHWDLALTQAEKAIAELEPLGKRLKRILVVHPGTIEKYDQISALPLTEKMVNLLDDDLKDPQVMNVFAMEFLFRLFELTFELGNDPAAVLEHLQGRVRKYNNPGILIAESVVNHITFAALSGVPIVTDSVFAMEFLASQRPRIVDTENERLVRVDGLANELFDRLIGPHCPPLVGKHLERIITMLDQQSKALEAMRRTCREHSRRLILESPSDALLESAAKDTIASLSKDVASIVEIDSKATSSLVNNVLEDRVAWATILGFLGSGAAGLPIVVPAAFGLGALSVIGASVMKARREKEEKLKASPWAAVYQLRGKR